MRLPCLSDLGRHGLVEGPGVLDSPFVEAGCCFCDRECRPRLALRVRHRAHPEQGDDEGQKTCQEAALWC